MYRIIKSLVVFVLGMLSFSSLAQEKVNYKIACVGFYNLENLFDYEDDPLIRDEEYMPDSEKAWDSTKYHTKVNHMAKVISRIGTKYTPDGAAMLGVCEVENRGVLEDLVKDPQISERNYKIVHFDSPDKRGIDVGFLYQEKYFKFKHANKYPVTFLDAPEKKTRDQLVISGEMDGEEVNVIVAHWPSRGGGKQKSQPRRIEAAKVGRKIIDSLMTVNPAAKIIYMGDLNDDPVDVSCTDYIKARGKRNNLKKGELYNTMWDYYKAGNGTLAWRDTWNLFDQIIITKSMLAEDASTYVFHKAEVFRENFMIQQMGKYKGYPLRTFAGGLYTNGYSDHFPTYIILKKIAK